MSNIKGFYEEKLNYIYYGILGMLRYGITELYINIEKKYLKEFQKYFSTRFSSEYKNNFLEFKVEDISNEYKFKFSILKKKTYS